MALTYEQQKALNSHLQKTGRNVLEKIIIWGSQLVSAVISFTFSIIRQIIGK